MHDLLSSLLMHPFEKEAISPLAAGARTLYWGARPDNALLDRKNFDCLQSFKPYADEWVSEGVRNLTKMPEDKRYDAVFCVLSKQKEAARYQLAGALEVLEEGGLLLAVAGNETGGKRLTKWFGDLGLQAESLSKSKCRIVWAYKKDINQFVVNDYIKDGSRQVININDNSFETKPGIFGWNKIDQGSKLLIETLPSLFGTGADFGCGYGYLSKEILGGNNQIKNLYAFDADYDALECCKINLKKYEDNTHISFDWLDLTQGLSKILPLDFIVMNPPFHQGKDTSVDTGQQFIESAAKALRKKGVLYMVANAHLPYEKLLGTLFFEVTKIEEKQGFKVIHAVK